MPFDRLIKTVDQWAGTKGRKDVYAQIGQSEYRPTNIQWTKFLDPETFKRKYEESDVVIAHAGTGSIITALQLGKPVVIMPRYAELKETRNDHQSATCRMFTQFDSVEVAWDEQELVSKLEIIDCLHGSSKIQKYASGELVKVIQDFISVC